MKQKFYIVKENDKNVIYKVDKLSVPSFEEKNRDNIVVTASDLQELIAQFDKQTGDKLELNKRVHNVTCQVMYRGSITKEKLNRSNY